MTHVTFIGALLGDCCASASRPASTKPAPAAPTTAMASRRPMASPVALLKSLDMRGSVALGRQPRFVYDQTMNVTDPDAAVAPIAAAIGEPARARMLYCLVDGRARTSTELAVVAEVTPSTARMPLRRLKTQRLVKVFAQGKHRYYSLDRQDV